MIVDNIISRRGILPHCTKIMATHNKTAVAAADHVIVMRSGYIAASGDLSCEKVTRRG
jgi:ABC-type bacteriocin/lantibiotic exporter with double-glycine peptidase domain